LSQSYFNFSLATIKVDAIPKFNTNDAGSDVLVGRDYKIMYGFSIDINYSSNSDKKMIWKNESHLFFNEFNHTGLCLTMNNKIEYRLLRNLVIRYDSGLRYEPLVYRGMRFIQELELCLPLTFNKEMNLLQSSRVRRFHFWTKSIICSLGNPFGMHFLLIQKMHI
jgi:hypothetical protein